jgi:Zn-dependent M28 family amino/carboxypeptidase
MIFDSSFSSSSFSSSSLFSSSSSYLLCSFYQNCNVQSPNVIATWTGKDPAEWVVAGAHYDSRSEDSSSETNRAPGADDNGSGTSAMLELAKIVNTTSTDFGLARGLKLCFFSGEEQGLLGSRALAAQYKAQGVDVVAMVNADMLGYQATAEVTLGFKDRSVTPELVTLAKDLTAMYVPGLPTADSSSCCSDYLSFWEEGFPSVGFFENGEAASNYPSYHTETDLLSYVNTKQLVLETQAVAATVFTLLLD